MLNSSRMLKRHIPTSLIISFFLVLPLTIFTFRTNFLLNIGMVSWTNSVFTETPPRKSIYWFQLLQEKNLDTVPYVIGDAYWRSGDEPTAIDIWKKNNVSNRLSGITKSLVESKDYSLASEILDKLEKLDTCMVSVWFLRAQIAEAHMMWEDALERYEKSTNFKVTDCDHFGHSDAFYHMGNIWQYHMEPANVEKAMDYYEQASNTNDFSDQMLATNSHYRLGQILFVRSSNILSAIDELDKALSIQPDHSWANLFLGRALYKQYGNFQLAEPYLQAGFRRDSGQNWQFSYFLAEIYAEEGYLLEAVTYSRKALSISPKNEHIQKQLFSLESKLETLHLQINPNKIEYGYLTFH